MLGLGSISGGGVVGLPHHQSCVMHLLQCWSSILRGLVEAMLG